MFIGKKLLVATMPYTYLGFCVAEEGQYLVLQQVNYVFDTGNYGDFINTGEAIAVEVLSPEINVYLQHRNIIEISEWQHELFVESFDHKKEFE